MLALLEFGPGDSIAELTSLLHECYRTLKEQGWNFTAADQSEGTTKSRIQCGHCFLVTSGSKAVGTILLVTKPQENGPKHYQDEKVAVISQFGVLPDFRNQGIGAMLLAHAENIAREKNFRALLLDTAKPATELIAYYNKKGFRPIAEYQWSGKNYVSVVMERVLEESIKRDS